MKIKADALLGLAMALDRADRATAVTAFACGQCDRVYLEQDEARECCTCGECHTKFKKEGYAPHCGHCSYGHSLRSARAAVRREEESLARAKLRLAKLLKDGRPQKGATP